MKRYQYILLDWDGNLAKTLDIWLEALRIPLEKRGHSLTDKEIGANFDALKERLEAQGYKDIDAIINEADAIAAKNVPSVELYPNALEVLESLHQSGKQLALITTSSHQQIDPLLKKYNMLQLFDAVVCGDDVEHPKPHAEPIKKALEELNGNTEQAVMIGDSEKDINAVINAGIDSILFYPPEHEKFHNIQHLRQLKPTFVIQDFRQILQIV
ncbi:MAG: HAD-IA family hydrolase [bacterium]|nr:HAD-IA family hydrolase [bacterium]